MKNHPEGAIYLSDLFAHRKPFLKYFARRWAALLIALLFGAGLGIAYFYFQKPSYKAECTFVLEEKQAGLGGLGGLASQFGFDLGSLSGGGNLYAGENIFEILKSKKILQKVLLSKPDSAAAQGKTLADMYIDFSRLKKKWKDDASLMAVSFRDCPQPLSMVQDSVLNIIYDQVIDKYLVVDKAGKKGNLIKVQVKSENRLFAVLLAQRMVEEAKNFYILIKTGNAQSNINNLQQKADSLLRLLNGKTYVAAQTQIVDANPGLSFLRVPTEIASRDKTVVGTLYAEVVKNLEASKMILAQQTPIIQVIDYPSLSTRDQSVSLKKLVVIGVVSMLFLFFVSTLVQYILKEN